MPINISDSSRSFIEFKSLSAFHLASADNPSEPPPSIPDRSVTSRDSTTQAQHTLRLAPLSILQIYPSNESPPDYPPLLALTANNVAYLQQYDSIARFNLHIGQSYHSGTYTLFSGSTAGGFSPSILRRGAGLWKYRYRSKFLHTLLSTC